MRGGFVVSQTIQGKSDITDFLSRIGVHLHPPSVTDRILLLISLLEESGLSFSSGALYYRSQDGINSLTALFPFEFSRWHKQGSLLLRFRWDGQKIRCIWMTINGFPVEDNPVYKTVALANRSHEAHFFALGNLYSETPLAYKVYKKHEEDSVEIVGFAPWIRILLSPAMSFVTQKERIEKYIRSMVEYEASIPHFAGTEIDGNQNTDESKKDFLVFGYLPWEKILFRDIHLRAELFVPPRSYLNLVTSSGIMLAPLTAIPEMLPEIPEGKSPQEYATVCAPAGRVFAVLKERWEVVADHPYLLVSSDRLTADNLWESPNVEHIRQAIALLSHNPSDPDWVLSNELS